MFVSISHALLQTDTRHKRADIGIAS